MTLTKSGADAYPVTAIVNFPLKDGITIDQVRDLFMASAPRYQEPAGLIRKYYLFDEAEPSGGGVYLWKTREHAEAFYTPEWKAGLKERLGAFPEIRFFVSPVIVDNVTGEIMSGSDVTK